MGILINGRFGTQLFDPFCNGRHATGNLSMGLQTGSDAWSGKAVLGGHLAYFGGKGVFLEYNTATNTTRTLAPFTSLRKNYVMSLFGNRGNVLVCGGVDHQNGEMSSCELYTPVNNTWTTFASLPVAVTHFAMVTLLKCAGNGGQPFVFGGFSWAGSTHVASVYAYMDNTSEWRARESMPTAIASHAALQIDHAIALVCGGHSGYNLQSACNTYHAMDDVWSPVSAMNAARQSHGMAVYNGRAWVYGGRDGAGHLLSSVEWHGLDDMSTGQWYTHHASLFTADDFFCTRYNAVLLNTSSFQLSSSVHENAFWLIKFILVYLYILCY